MLIIKAGPMVIHLEINSRTRATVVNMKHCSPAGGLAAAAATGVKAFILCLSEPKPSPRCVIEIPIANQYMPQANTLDAEPQEQAIGNDSVESREIF